MIPRTVKRMFDERAEDAVEAESQTAVLSLRGRNHIVSLVNLSRLGAMLRFTGDAHIGESVSLQLLDRGTIARSGALAARRADGRIFRQPAGVALAWR